MRQPGVIALIDSVVAQVTWARRGTWIGQHDPDFLPNGNTLITESDRGRLLEVSPAGERLFGNTLIPIVADLITLIHRRSCGVSVICRKN